VIQDADNTLYFTSDGITFALIGKEYDETQRWSVKLDFVGANTIKPKGEDRQEAVFSYFKGKKEDWKTSLPTYSQLVYENLWPGIDLVYTGTINRLKYKFIVKPNADPNQICLSYKGASDLLVTDNGELNVTTPVGEIVDGTPYAYQESSNRRIDVPMSYDLCGGTKDNGFDYRFRVGSYDTTKPLILDPHLLVYCGYIGGSGF